MQKLQLENKPLADGITANLYRHSYYLTEELAVLSLVEDSENENLEKKIYFSQDPNQVLQVEKPKLPEPKVSAESLHEFAGP